MGNIETRDSLAYFFDLAYGNLIDETGPIHGPVITPSEDFQGVRSPQYYSHSNRFNYGVLPLFLPRKC